MDIHELSKLKPFILDNLPSDISTKLIQISETILSTDGDDRKKAISEFIECCCAYSPKDFQQYTTFVMIACFFELINISSFVIQRQKYQLLSHAFCLFVDHWFQDLEKVIKTLFLFTCLFDVSYFFVRLFL